MEFVISEKVIAECNRAKEETQYLTEYKKREVDYSLSKKVENLEYFYKELLQQKDTLSAEMKELYPFQHRIYLMKGSLNHPKHVSKKCMEMRKDRTGEDSYIDTVENELKKEIKKIEDSEVFLEELLGEVKEQLRKYRVIIYRLKQDLSKKEVALTVEKYNSELRPTDLCLVADPTKGVQSQANYLPTNTETNDWEHETGQLLNRAKDELKIGRKLRYRTEELLTVKTKELQDQHDYCNDIFHKRITEYKEAKDFLENRLSKTNEQIFKMKLNMKELENAISEKEPNINVARIRLKNRVYNFQAELQGDEVEVRLVDEIKGLQMITNTLIEKYSLAQSTLLSLNKLKDYLDREIQVKTNSVKIDEVQCLTLRSSVHYYAY